MALIDNQACESECNNMACNYDGEDCCFTTCYYDDLFDASCQQSCNTPQCSYDNGNCKCSNEQYDCLDEMKGDGVCDEDCDYSDC